MAPTSWREAHSHELRWWWLRNVLDDFWGARDFSKLILPGLKALLTYAQRILRWYLKRCLPWSLPLISACGFFLLSQGLFPSSAPSLPLTSLLNSFHTPFPWLLPPLIPKPPFNLFAFPLPSFYSRLLSHCPLPCSFPSPHQPRLEQC